MNAGSLWLLGLITRQECGMWDLYESPILNTSLIRRIWMFEKEPEQVLYSSKQTIMSTNELPCLYLFALVKVDFLFHLIARIYHECQKNIVSKLFLVIIHPIANINWTLSLIELCFVGVSIC